MPYDVLVIATGAAARPSPWLPASGVYQLRTLADARVIAARLALGEPVVVVGGGFIGTEIAAAAGAVTVNWVRALTQARRRLAAGESAAAIADAIRQLPA